MYEQSLDQAGHLTGPQSALVNVSTFAWGNYTLRKFLTRPVQQTLANIDIFAGNLIDSLEIRNLTDIVDIIIVSDHGMTDTSDPEFVYMDDILGDGFRDLEHIDGECNFGFQRFRTTDLSV